MCTVIKSLLQHRAALCRSHLARPVRNRLCVVVLMMMLLLLLLLEPEQRMYEHLRVVSPQLCQRLGQFLPRHMVCNTEIHVGSMTSLPCEMERYLAA